MTKEELLDTVAKFGLTKHMYLRGKVYFLYNRAVIYCPEDHRIGKVYPLLHNGLINFDEEYTSTDKLEKFLIKKTKEIKDNETDLRMIKMKEDFE